MNPSTTPTEHRGKEPNTFGTSIGFSIIEEAFDRRAIPPPAGTVSQADIDRNQQLRLLETHHVSTRAIEHPHNVSQAIQLNFRLQNGTSSSTSNPMGSI